VSGVWGPAQEPISYPLVVAGTLIAVLLVQTVIVVRRSRKKLTKDVSEP
jgi:hypothetical protein